MPRTSSSAILAAVMRIETFWTIVSDGSSPA
jgi:hypothetical protein